MAAADMPDPNKPRVPSGTVPPGRVREPSVYQTPDTLPFAVDADDFKTSVLADDGLQQDISEFDAGRMPSLEELKKRRKQQTAEDKRVADEAMVWMGALPRELRMMHTMLNHPHVVNGLVQRWNQPEPLTVYFQNLLASRRRGRVGFLPPVKAELLALRSYAAKQGRLVLETKPSLEGSVRRR
jgi:hypothetical protein